MYRDDMATPQTGAGSTVTSSECLPESMVTDKKAGTNVVAGGMCKDPLIDLVHVTGNKTEFWLLDATGSDVLDEEVQLVEKWLSEYRSVFQKSAQETDPEKEDENAKARMCKLEEGIELGIIALGKPKKDDDEEEKKDITLSQDDISGLISSLQKDRKAIEGHSPYLWEKNYLADNYDTLKKARLAIIDAELKRLNSNQTKMPKKSKTFAGFGERKYTLGKTVDTGKAYKANKQGFEVVEFVRASSPDKFYYARKSFIEETRFSARVRKVEATKETRELIRQKANAKAIASALKKDITDAAAKQFSDYRTDPLKETAFKFFERKAYEDHAFNALHIELLNIEREDSTPDSIVGWTAEAHALRFAAAASAEVKGFDRATMGGSLSMGGNAALSILEASVSGTVMLPRAAGYDCYISYENENKETIYHRIGAFRLKGELVLSCFAGAKANASGTLSLQLKPGEKEVPSGATALLDPNISVGQTPGGNVGIKGGLFAGAEAGGSVTGAIEWQHPDEQQLTKGKWNALAEIKAGGAVQVGAGLSGSFQVRIAGGDFLFIAHGSLAFGPGAGGEFAVTVDLSNIYDLLSVIVDILQDIDYRHLNAIHPDAFEVFYRGVYKYYADPELVLDAAFEDVYEIFSDIEDWWDDRASDQEEAYALAKSINGGYKKWTVDKLVPELIGPMLYTLTKTWILMDEAQQTEQEEAIVKLLAPIKSWRLFSESLQRMTEDGGKKGGSAESKADTLFTGLERINSILDGRQQQQFNAWVAQLEHLQPGQNVTDTRMAVLPFQPDYQPQMKYGQVRQQVMIAWRNDLPSDQRYA